MFRIALVLGLMLEASAAFANPIPDCGASIRLGPGDKEYLLVRGICELNHGNVDGAIADFDRFISEHPEWVAGYFNRGNAHVAKQQYQSAIADFDEALRRTPKDPAGIFWNRGNAYAELQDYARAIADYDRAIELAFSHSDQYRIRAEVHEKAGSRSLAIEDYRKALKLDPGNRAARNGLDELTTTPVPPPGAGAQTATFDTPRYGAYRLDWCRYWSRGCGKPAADEFCRRRGFDRARNFAPAVNAGVREPTMVIGTGQLCAGMSCRGFASISCMK